MLAFEQLEAARYLPYLKAGGSVVVNTQQMDPMPVVTGDRPYPDGLLEKMREQGVASRAGRVVPRGRGRSAKAVNVVLIGAMAKSLDIDKEVWLAPLKRRCRRNLSI